MYKSKICVCLALSKAADLLGLDCAQLAEVLTHRSMILRGEEICTPLTVEQVTWVLKTTFPIKHHNLTP